MDKKVFSSFWEVENFVNELRSEFHPLKVNKSQTVDSYNKKLKDREFWIPEDVKYVYISYCCKHYGIHKTRSKGLRRVHQVLSNGCKFRIAFKYNREVKGFEIYEQFKEHNHEYGEEVFNLYAENRRKAEANPALSRSLLKTKYYVKRRRYLKDKFLKAEKEKKSRMAVDTDLQPVLKRIVSLSNPLSHPPSSPENFPGESSSKNLHTEDSHGDGKLTPEKSYGNLVDDAGVMPVSSKTVDRAESFSGNFPGESSSRNLPKIDSRGKFRPEKSNQSSVDDVEVPVTPTPIGKAKQNNSKKLKIEDALVELIGVVRELDKPKTENDHFLAMLKHKLEAIKDKEKLSHMHIEILSYVHANSSD